MEVGDASTPSFSHGCDWISWLQPRRRTAASRPSACTALVRPGSEARVAPGCEIVHGDALRADSYAANIGDADTFVHLVGVAHPSPSKAAEFRAIDLVSCREAVKAAKADRHSAFRVSQRGPSGSHDEGLPGGSSGRRANGSGPGNSHDLCASVVCAGPGPKLADCAQASLRVGARCSRLHATAQIDWHWLRWSR